jgi:uncharacterized sulfatase
MVGKFQSRFGVESNGCALDGFDRETTIAQRLQAAGYVTAQFGKWHLGPSAEITRHGFRHVYAQNSQAPFSANITMDGKDRPMSVLQPEAYHIDGCSRAAASLIKRYHDQPLFLYVAYRAPHVPLDAPPKYLDRFPGEMPERRRQALAMLSAVDDGVGLVIKTLEEHGLGERTLVFYIGDNGAPLKIHKFDAPGGGPGWDGSLNDPLNGEKGMLAEGGMHTPFVVSWPDVIPGGQQYPHPISALDVAATAAAAAGIETSPGDLDGVNLVPFLSGQDATAPHDALMWRWTTQSAIREGNWKLLRGGDREYLYNLDADLEEQHNLAAKHPEIADRLRKRLEQWAAELSPPGLATGKMNVAATSYFDFYLDGKPPQPLRDKFRPNSPSEPTSATGIPWLIRNGRLRKTEDGIEIQPVQGAAERPAFLARNGLNLSGPVTIEIVAKTSEAGPVVVSWRSSDDAEFRPACQTTISVGEAGQWQDLRATFGHADKIVHVRIQVPRGTTRLKSVRLTAAEGRPVTLQR